MSHEPAASVRRATPSDAAAVASLRRHWCEEDAGEPLDDAGFEDRFAAWFRAEADRRATFLAEVDGAAVGMVNLAVFERMPRPGRPGSRWGYLSNAFVLAAHRDHGIGGALLRALLAEADARGCVRVVLSPSERSVRFYERAGFGPASMLLVRNM